jgi:hypothetical protein
MSIYAVNKIMFKLRNDDAFKERMQQDPLEVVQEFALSAEERDALTRGDVRTLFEMGAHAYLLQQLSGARLFGVNNQNYQPRIRGQERPD